MELFRAWLRGPGMRLRLWDPATGRSGVVAWARGCALRSRPSALGAFVGGRRLALGVVGDGDSSGAGRHARYTARAPWRSRCWLAGVEGLEGDGFGSFEVVAEGVDELHLAGGF